MSSFRRRLMSVLSSKPQYTELEYLKAKSGQWIDTEYIPNNNTAVEIYGNQVSLTDSSLFGSNPYFVITSSSSNYLFRYNNKSIRSSVVANVLSKLKLDKNKAYIDDNLINTFGEFEFKATYNALLFGRHNQSGGLEEVAGGTIYYCKIWDNDVLVRDFIPILDKNEIPCMYDKIGQKFYYNKGTGEFLYGLKEAIE